jgi:hypothetical protein
MTRFEKTRIHPASAVLFLLGLYALAGLAYAAWTHSADSVATWAVIGGAAFIASYGYQRYVTRNRGRGR